ncbi:hypothetical protein MKQ70_14855 [Chitinophaga sedimenti]|uniref:hypothetical protein n=1 Tax=Chitinophaga sedimenti TaxID=2033606 RepID=UPI0020066A56|nr:hypothetical protein [Chitinophaga sedimenti]MCK7556223.1 hypothetical protein [Chitinophaga sedimenti]
MEQPIKFGITAGFSYNLENFSSLIGPSITIGDFISLNTGIALAQKDMLKGKYNAGDKISENLDFDQLHTKTWTYDLFFSIGLRFEGLFKKVDEKEKTTSK